MIIYALANGILRILTAVFVVELPQFPEVVTTGLQTVQQTLISGIGLAAGIFGYPVLHAGVTCCRLILLLFGMWLAYDLFRWFITKIPFLGIEA